MPNLCFAQHRWRAGFACGSAFLCVVPWLLAETPPAGTLVGRVISTATGEAVPGAIVRLENVDRVTTADLNGAFRFDNLAEGTYAIAADGEDFRHSVVSSLVVVSGATVRYNVPLTPVTAAAAEDAPRPEGDDVVHLDSLVVQADVAANSDLGLLSARQKAAAVSDAISTDSITRLGFTDAASAMRSVTGASVVGDKYVLIRGMGDRYGSTSLNGAEIPSADPDRRAVQLDLFNAKLIDAIVTTKTFTPDRPGSFAGGSVDIQTKTVPDGRSAATSLTVGYNPEITGKSFLVSGGATDWLGRDEGSRKLPAEIAALSGFPPRGGSVPDTEIGRLARLFSPEMAPLPGKEAGYNWSGSFSYGDRFASRAGVLGVLVSATYDHLFSGYRDGRFTRNDLQGSGAPELQPLIDLTDTRNTEEINAGALVRFGWQPSPNHELGFTFLDNTASEDVARVEVGTYLAGGGLDGDQIYTTRTLRLIEREVTSYQLNGRHLFAAADGISIQWQAAHSSNTQSEPDVRFFSTAGRDVGGGQVDYIWSTSGVPQPQRYFRDLNETRDEGHVDFALPVNLGGRIQGKLKAGVLAADSDRAFRERSFTYQNAGGRFFLGDDQTFFAPEYVGTVGTNGRFIPDTVFMFENTAARNSYDGTSSLRAGYLMGDVVLSERWRAIVGARFESFQMEVTSHDTTLQPGILDNGDLLPSINLVYEMRPGMNLRLAYGRTLARPNFREIAPYRTYESQGDPETFGNPELERTLIDNFDLRWEWFGKKQDLAAVSLFYKRLKNPIEKAYYAPGGVIINAGAITWQNQDTGQVAGVELEGRQGLGRIASLLDHFSLGGNFTWSDSETTIPAEEVVQARALNPDSGDTRPLAGQSTYLANIDLSYQDLERGTVISAYYNIFGERLAVVAPIGTPDIYEQSVPTLDLVLRQRFGPHWRVEFKARNLLDPAFRETQVYHDVEYVRSSYHRGRAFSMSLNFDY